MVQSAANRKRDQLEWPFNPPHFLGSNGGVAVTVPLPYTARSTVPAEIGMGLRRTGVAYIYVGGEAIRSNVVYTQSNPL